MNWIFRTGIVALAGMLLTSADAFAGFAEGPQFRPGGAQAPLNGNNAPYPVFRPWRSAGRPVSSPVPRHLPPAAPHLMAYQGFPRPPYPGYQAYQAHYPLPPTAYYPARNPYAVSGYGYPQHYQSAPHYPQYAALPYTVSPYYRHAPLASFAPPHFQYPPAPAVNPGSTYMPPSYAMPWQPANTLNRPNYARKVMPNANFGSNVVYPVQPGAEDHSSFPYRQSPDAPFMPAYGYPVSKNSAPYSPYPPARPYQPAPMYYSTSGAGFMPPGRSDVTRNSYQRGPANRGYAPAYRPVENRDTTVREMNRPNSWSGTESMGMNSYQFRPLNSGNTRDNAQGVHPDPYAPRNASQFVTQFPNG